MAEEFAEEFAELPADAVVLGTQMAAALAQERRHVPSGPSPIAGIEYPAGSTDMWRWVDRPQDEQIAAFVGAFVAADAAHRVTMRQNLTMDDLYTMLLFARRRAFAAIRTGDPVAAGDAFDALSAIDVARVDWRDVSVAAMLAAYAASCTPVPAVAVAAGSIERAESQVAQMLSAAVSRGDVDLAGSCGYRVVATTTGPVLFDDHFGRYRPKRDLAAIAFDVAAALEAEGVYRVDSLGVGGKLAPIWVGGDADPNVTAAIRHVRGCASVSGGPVAVPDGNPHDHFLNVYVLEAANPEDAASIIRGSMRGGRQGSEVLGVAAGQLCAVVVAACVMAGQPSFETSASMDRFRDMISPLLG